MRVFLLQYCPMILLVMLPANVATVLWFARRWYRSRRFSALCMCLITAGLLYDGSILLLGAVYDGALLEPLSQARYILHGVLGPMLLCVCADSVAASPRARRIVFIVAAVMAAGGLISGLTTDLYPVYLAHLNRFAMASTTALWASAWTNLISFGTILPLIAAGAVVAVKRHTPTLLVGGLLMFLFAGLGPATGNTDLTFFITMLGEELMVLSFVLYDRRLDAAGASIEEGSAH